MMQVLRVSNASADWRGYVDFVNNRVVNGLAHVIMSSLEYFQNEIDPKVSLCKQEPFKDNRFHANQHI